MIRHDRCLGWCFTDLSGAGGKLPGEEAGKGAVTARSPDWQAAGTHRAVTAGGRDGGGRVGTLKRGGVRGRRHRDDPSLERDGLPFCFGGGILVYDARTKGSR
jgi:hypothetical protein